MCGRIEFHVESIEELEERYGVKMTHGRTVQGFHYPKYNIPPTSHHPLLTSSEPDELVMSHWGYLPEWAQKGGKYHAVINARAESAFEKPFFRGAIRHHRCLIPVTGFYEWHRVEKQKTPYYFHRDGEIFSIGGVYSTVKDENGLEMPHFAILTTEANSLMAPVHDRIPVIIEDKHEKEWIDEGLPDDEVHKYFKAVPSSYLKKYEISSLVNSVKNDSPAIIEPVNRLAV
jgi:putative SOS response-associated peptidase YedK